MYDSDIKKFKFASAGKLYIMTADVLQLEQGTVPGVVTVYDVKNLSLSHLLSTPISTIRHYVVYSQVKIKYTLSYNIAITLINIERRR